jgi:hypothetical protein
MSAREAATTPIGTPTHTNIDEHGQRDLRNNMLLAGIFEQRRTPPIIVPRLHTAEVAGSNPASPTFTSLTIARGIWIWAHDLLRTYSEWTSLTVQAVRVNYPAKHCRCGLRSYAADSCAGIITVFMQRGACLSTTTRCRPQRTGAEALDGLLGPIGPGLCRMLNLDFR